MFEVQVCSDVQAPAYSTSFGKNTFWISEDISFYLEEACVASIKSFAQYKDNIKHNEELYIVSGVFSTENKIPQNLINCFQCFKPKLILFKDGIFTYQIVPE